MDKEYGGGGGSYGICYNRIGDACFPSRLPYFQNREIYTTEVLIFNHAFPHPNPLHQLDPSPLSSDSLPNL